MYFIFYRYLSQLDEATVTALEIEPEPVAPAVQNELAFGPMTSEEYRVDMKTRLSSAIEGLVLPNENLQKYLEFFKADRVVVEVNKIVDLFERQCSEVGCNGMRKVIDKKVEAGVLLIIHQCSKGHGGVWSSSSVLGEKRGQKMFVSSTTFSRIQSLYALPSIGDLWSKMKEVIWKVFEKDVLVVCGDGRMDSPGFSAKYCVYTMMEHYLNVIVDLEVVDKREAGGTSTLMEKMGCKRLLERMMNSLNLGEVVTDASKVIMKMVRELKGMSVHQCVY